MTTNMERDHMTAHCDDNRYVAYARCACPQDATVNLDRQIHAIRRFAEGHAMRCVGEVRLAGVSGGEPAMREDLRALILRKRERDDYDVLIMEDFARLTRAGITEGMQIEAEFAKCGVRIVYVTDTA
jgi:molybdenum cofactor biosynthesis enzyme MoaA